MSYFASSSVERSSSPVDSVWSCQRFVFEISVLFVMFIVSFICMGILRTWKLGEETSFLVGEMTTSLDLQKQDPAGKRAFSGRSRGGGTEENHGVRHCDVGH
jgi:hypothetical protein